MPAALRVSLAGPAVPRAGASGRAAGLASLLAACAVLALGLLGAAPARAASYVEFTFQLPAAAGNPFARDLRAEVRKPDGSTVRLPAFVAGDADFSVRARADQAGAYTVTKVTEISASGTAEVRQPAFSGGAERHVRTVALRPDVRIAANDSRAFSLSDGRPYIPLGTNLPWPFGSKRGFYDRALAEFEEAGLNWTRIWMSHWGGLNLDWHSEEGGPSPKPGTLDLAVARQWDHILAEAERRGVYVQVVFQHHGQFSTEVNPNWADHPWNAANPGGFLAKPEEFFTSPEARRLTKLKYRYIVARWAWSPAVMAWELFNEVHFTDAIKLRHDEAAVAAWHAEMADYLRSIDAYRHLVTTSTDELASPIYDRLDYLQPHLYASNMIASLRRFGVPPAELTKPVFYGEMGDERMPLSPAYHQSGAALAPLAWVGAMSDGTAPAQLWQWDRLIRTTRMAELRSLSRYLERAALPGRRGLRAFSPATESDVRVPVVLTSGFVWDKRADADLTLAADGREPVELADLPHWFVGTENAAGPGYSRRSTLRVTWPKDTTVTIKLRNGGGEKGASLRATLDDLPPFAYDWPAIPSDPVAAATPAAKRAAPAPRPAEVSFPVSAGAHTLVLENIGADSFELGSIDLGFEQPAFAAVGRRSADFVMLYLWRRDGLFTAAPAAPAAGAVLLDDLPAGTWQLTWWDPARDAPDGAPSTLDHAGGTLRIAVPGLVRHRALLLERK